MIWCSCSAECWVCFFFFIKKKKSFRKVWNLSQFCLVAQCIGIVYLAWMCTPMSVASVSVPLPDTTWRKASHFLRLHARKRLRTTSPTGNQHAHAQRLTNSYNKTSAQTGQQQLSEWLLNDQGHFKAKCFEWLVLKHIKSTLPPTLDQHQYAYRGNRSTEDAISTALHTALIDLEQKGTYVRMLLIDYSSLFNTVVPSRLVLLDLSLSNSCACWSRTSYWTAQSHTLCPSGARLILSTGITKG